MSLRLLSIAACIVAVAATAAPAQLTTYSQDFEGFTSALDIPNAGDPGSSEIADDGFLVNGSVFAGTPDAPGAFNFFFGNFPAPNFSTNAGFTGIVADQGNGTAQGTRHLNVFSDFNEGLSHGGADGDFFIDARAFQEQTIGAADVGTTAVFDFEFKRNNELNVNDFGPSGNTETFAFVRVLDSVSGTFATLAETNFETTNADLINFSTGQISLDIDASLDGQLLQFGFFSLAQDFNGSGIVYDNLNFTNSAVIAAIPEPSSVLALLLGGVVMITKRRRNS